MRISDWSSDVCSSDLLWRSSPHYATRARLKSTSSCHSHRWSLSWRAAGSATPVSHIIIASRMDMELPQKIFHRDRLRVARAIALADAEGFHATFHALELLGQQLTGKIGGLAEYQGELSELARSDEHKSELQSL